MIHKLNKELENKIKEALELGISVKEIAKLFNVCRETIRRKSRLFGITTFKGKTNVFTLNTCPNDLLLLIIGSLLGDGSFQKYGNSGELIIVHSYKLLEYLQYKTNILKQYNLANKIYESKVTDIRFKNPEYINYTVKSRRNPIFTLVRNMCYQEDNKKHINLDLLLNMDALGLAIWYMDDGYVTSNSCIFSTCSFPVEEQKQLSIFLLGKFGLHFSYGKNDNSLYLYKEDFELFKSIVSPYILDSLKYKLIPYKERVHLKQGELLETPEVDNQQPSTPLTKCEGSETNS